MAAEASVREAIESLFQFHQVTGSNRDAGEIDRLRGQLDILTAEETTP